MHLTVLSGVGVRLESCANVVGDDLLKTPLAVGQRHLEMVTTTGGMSIRLGAES